MSRKIPNEELQRLSVQEYKQAEKHPIVIVLDNVRSRQNIGSIFRTADAFLIESIYLCGISATPPHRDITRTALGATETVAWKYADQTIEALNYLNENEYNIVAVEQVEGATSLEKLSWDGKEKLALIFGHEVNGVSQEVVDYCDSAIEIPQFGAKHSFNISVSAGVVLWHLVSQTLA